MTQSSAPPPPPPPLAPPTPPPPPPPTPPPPQQTESVRVRCAGCRMILTVAPGLTEFACPTCRMPQMLPPELMPRERAAAANAPTTVPPTSAPPSQPPHAPAHGIDPTKIQLPCASCKAILNVPHGLARFACPQCNVDLAVDVSKVKQFFPAAPPPEEVNEVCLLSVASLVLIDDFGN